MKALTLTQPWATLMALQEKRIETRSWPTKYRGDRCRESLKAVEDRKEARKRLGAAKRAVGAVGKRMKVTA